jgi:hypothetical protein
MLGTYASADPVKASSTDQHPQPTGSAHGLVQSIRRKGKQSRSFIVWLHASQGRSLPPLCVLPMLTLDPGECKLLLHKHTRKCLGT